MSDDEKGTDPQQQPDSEARKTASADPFATGGLDFDAAEKRRQRAIEKDKAKQAELGIEMDGDIAVRKIGSLFDDDPPAPSSARKTRSSGDTPLQEKPFEMSQEEQEAEMLRKMKEMNDRERERNTIRVGEKTLTKWPYDDYHQVQKEYWEHYFEREEQERLKRQQRLDGSESDSSISISSSEDDEDEDYSLSGSESSSQSTSSSDSSRSETSEERLDRKRAARRARKRLEARQRRIQEKKRIKRLNRETEVEQEKRRKLRQKAMEEEREAGLHDLKSDILVFDRPQDPPDLKQAVAGLPLTEFESVAKERAIAIASTWLFDAGLVQELMQTKKVKDKDNQIPEEEEKKKKIEIKIVPLGGEKKKKEPEKQQRTTPKRTKMDYEIEKLEKTVTKQLALINNRLNNGVASSGYEVQELVNSVVSTKSELVRLRETSSMLSNAGDTLDGVAGAAATQTTFAINKYPHLKFAINARRNLQKCFRELAFFSQIPENCSRLQNELSEAEYSDSEMTTLRNVCKEHVELEIFLVEAEAGMRKKQVDDDDDDEDGRRRSGVGFKRTGLDVGLPQNNDDVDRFLKEHVQIVLELGDEIQQKIRYGIGTSFELAFNNPAGMVALVEAVEIYETANREYQAVHGDEDKSGGPKSLRFTDMRALALRELYEDMSERYVLIAASVTWQLSSDHHVYQASSLFGFSNV